ncbi:MAG TPA: phosphatase PAP2 family protein [Terriglobales bacterium]|nr:phosphatase PAP2 family protein [Terriglobales bacterium]
MHRICLTAILLAAALWAQTPAPPGTPRENAAKPLPVGNTALITSERLAKGTIAFPRSVAHHWRLATGLTLGFVAIAATADAPASGTIHSLSEEKRSRLTSDYLLDVAEPSLALGVVFTGHENRWQSLELIAVSAGAGALFSSALKYASGRERPYTIGDANGAFLEGGDSFPSGHTTIAFSIDSALVHRYPRRGWVRWAAYGLGTAVGALRFTAKQHYPTDIAIGGGLGYLIGRCAIDCH